MEQEVFISYAWGGESEEITNEIDKAFEHKGIKIVRDKRDLEFKGIISDFMRRIGNGKAVIVVISDKYLKSQYCMFELLEIYQNRDFINRIFPVMLSDAEIIDPISKLDYLTYWKNEKEKLDKAIKEHGLDAITVVGDDYKTYKRIYDHLGKLTNLLTDINSLTPQIHTSENFRSLISSVENQLKKDDEDLLNSNKPNDPTEIISYLEREWEWRLESCKKQLENLKARTALNSILDLEQSFERQEHHPKASLRARLEYLKAQCYEFLDPQKSHPCFVKAYKLSTQNTGYKIKASFAYYNLGETKKAKEISEEILEVEEFNSIAWGVKLLTSPKENLQTMINSVPKATIEDKNFMRFFFFKFDFFNQTSEFESPYTQEQYIEQTTELLNTPLSFENHKEYIFHIELILFYFSSTLYFSFYEPVIGEENKGLLKRANQLLLNFLSRIEEQEVSFNLNRFKLFQYCSDYVLTGNEAAVFKAKEVLSSFKEASSQEVMFVANLLQLIGDEEKAITLINKQETKTPELLVSIRPFPYLS